MNSEEANPLKDTFTKVEKKIEEIAVELEVKLPKGKIPLVFRIITLILLVGGLSILGSVFTDFSVPKNGGAILHFYRLITGLVFLIVAYGIDIRKRWSLWLYGTIVFIGLFLNLKFAIIPALLVFYLYTKRKMFERGALDDFSDKFFNTIKSKLNKFY